jgi:hypothetical protein
MTLIDHIRETVAARAKALDLSAYALAQRTGGLFLAHDNEGLSVWTESLQVKRAEVAEEKADKVWKQTASALIAIGLRCR